MGGTELAPAKTPVNIVVHIQESLKEGVIAKLDLWWRVLLLPLLLPFDQPESFCDSFLLFT